jgi:hypothetical protein
VILVVSGPDEKRLQIAEPAFVTVVTGLHRRWGRRRGPNQRRRPYPPGRVREWRSACRNTQHASSAIMLLFDDIARVIGPVLVPPRRAGAG